MICMFFRPQKLGPETMYLKPKDFARVLEVLRDVEKSAVYNVVIGGSLAQRMLVPEFGKSVAGKSLYDIDLAITDGSLSDSPLRPGIKDDFYVMHLVESKDSYAFGLIHKKTGFWVDIFSEPYKKVYKEIVVGGKQYPAESLETQILWMVRDIVSRMQKGAGIHRKHIARIEWLMTVPEFDRDAYSKEFEENREYYMKKVPDHIKPTIQNVFDFTLHATTSGKAYPHTYDAWSKKNYPDEIIRTPNGIAVESPQTFKKLWWWHVREWMRKTLR